MTRYASEYDEFEANLAKFHERTLEIMHEDFTETHPGIFAINSSVMDGHTCSDEETDDEEIASLARITKEADELKLLGRLVTISSGEIEITRLDLQNLSTVETALTDHPVTGSLEGVVLDAGIPKYQLSLPDISVDTHWLKGTITPKAISRVALNGLEMPVFQHKRKEARLPFEGKWTFSTYAIVMDANGNSSAGGSLPNYMGEPVIGDIYPPIFAEHPSK